MSNSQNPSNIKPKEKEYDIYKDSYLRYLGYSNEIGEAFRKVTSTKFVWATYLIEFIYFGADTIHKGHKAYNDPNQIDNKHLHVIKQSGYTILWQFFATCLIPPLCINIVVGASHKYLFKRGYSKNAIRYLPLSIGLALIPLFNIYVDPVVGNILDNVFERFLI